jgi:superkiller protein 8
LGIHHIAASADGGTVASAGFGGELKVWKYRDDSSKWVDGGTINESKVTGEVWAVALSQGGELLAATNYEGRVRLWDLKSPELAITKDYETKGSFGMCVAIVGDDVDHLHLTHKL